ncbi:MAG: aconitate hydratase [Clostridia bacterium]|nr:aconitate hydratase [Clostridia bacterium]
MGYTIGQKIIKEHLVSGNMKTGETVALKIDQTLTQDATGTMAYLEFEAMNIPRVKTELSVAYIDHNTLQTGFENADDHRFIQSVAKKRGVVFSKPGNGICHQVHLERFAIPGKTLIGSDSHTPTAGGMGMLAMGAGGLDVAVAMGGGAYYITMPKFVRITLKNSLSSFVSAKDIILEVLRILTVKGGVGKIIEYAGDGVKSLSVPERATITNMGAELGATTSIFPSDENTRQFLKAQGREEDYMPLSADEDAVYDEEIEIDLSKLEPMAACPHMPDKVKKISELGKLKVDQVLIGSCTNSSLADLLTVSEILKNKTVHSSVSLGISPGSKQVLTMLSETQALKNIIDSGARILECACGPCIGMGQSPSTDAISLRTFNRNFYGRSGTQSAQIYLVSPQTAAASAINGYLTDPRTLGEEVKINLPTQFVINDNLLEQPAPADKADEIEVIYGPNIKPFPDNEPLSDEIQAKVSLKVEDDITTDHIMPAGARVLPYRSNIPKISEFCFENVDPDFSKNCTALGESFVVAGLNYGQGSSREHAALVPKYLGVKAVIAKSFARIHAANLVNAGIIPLTFKNEKDYDKISKGDLLVLTSVFESLKTGDFRLINKTTNEEYELVGKFDKRQQEILRAGDLLKYTGANKDE